MQYQINISGLHYEQLKRHLYPGDGKESVAVALCGRLIHNELTKITIHQIVLIPYEDCYERDVDFIHWKTERTQPIFEKAYAKSLSILKIHSHPTGFPDFSKTDDKSDKEFFDSAYGWVGDHGPHASVVMLPDGELFGRIFLPQLKIVKVDKFLIAGDTIQIYPLPMNKDVDESGSRTAQAFGNKTYNFLKQLKIGVVGCSGTGSPTIEQLKRLGVGELVIADPDVVEYKNLNRILNTTANDALNERPKVEVIQEAINRTGLGTKVKSYQKNLYYDNELLKELATCDVIFGCMDSVDGRDLLNQLSTYFLLPYFDLGVKLEADGNGGIKDICGGVHYLQPGRSSLLTRGLYTEEDLKAAGALRRNPEEYANLLKNSYIKNIHVGRPAVISVNMLISSFGINDFLNRIHPYRNEDPSVYAVNAISLTGNYIVNTTESELPVDHYLFKKIGRGYTSPFLENTELSNEKNN